MAHVLLTNDDGVGREGLQTLRAELIGLGLRVTVMAPAENQSGMAKSVTCREPVSVEKVGDDDKNPIYACYGTPVDCVRVAMLSDLVGPVDVVASGINHGVNLGDDASFSGTLGAALEGAMLGRPAIAFSQQDDDGDFSLVSHGGHTFTWARFAAELVDLVAGLILPARIAFNVNIPHEVTGNECRLTRLGRFAYPEQWTPADPAAPGRWSVWSYANPSQPDPTMETAVDTDLVALAAGLISITPVSSVWTASEAAVGDLGPFEELAAAATRLLMDLRGRPAAHSGRA